MGINAVKAWAIERAKNTKQQRGEARWRLAGLLGGRGVLIALRLQIEGVWLRVGCETNAEVCQLQGGADGRGDKGGDGRDNCNDKGAQARWSNGVWWPLGQWGCSHVVGE